MVTNHVYKGSMRIVIVVTAGIPEYLVQKKKRILFFVFWSTVKEKYNHHRRKLRFDTVEEAKTYIKEQLD